MKPALRPIAGSSQPRTVSLLAANAEVTKLEAKHDDLVIKILNAPARRLSTLRFQLMAVHRDLLAAVARRDRIEAEMAGQRYLEAVREPGQPGQ